MEWHGHDKPVVIHLLRDLGENQPREQRSERDSPPMLQRQDQFARRIIVKRACRNSVMLRRGGHARRADCPLFGGIAQWALASTAARLTGNHHVSPARGAKTRLRSKSFAAQRATRRKEQISDRDEERVKLHRGLFYRLHGRAAQGSAAA